MDDYGFSLDDIDSMINEFSSGVDFNNYFTGEGGSNIDLGSIDSNAFSIDDIDKLIADTSNLGDVDLGNVDFGSLGLEGARSYDDLTAGDVAALDDLNASYWKDVYSEGLTPEQNAAREELLASLPAQDFGGADVNQYIDEYNANLKDIVENKGGYTSQWQDVDGRKVQVYDDGTGMAINPNTGAFKGLTDTEVKNLVDTKKLNTATSGYNKATGGTDIAPGGGTQVTLKDGSKGTLLTNGKVIDTNTGTVIGDNKDVVTPKTTTGGTSTGTTKTGTGQQGGLGALLPLLLGLLAMNRGGGGSSGVSSAVIPALTATQKQTPYTQIQQAAGYRPGQGGITYFNPVQYAPKMAAGGIADLNRGRLLDGPGDGVSDSIPAVIGGYAEGGQPARLARGEYVFDARTVAALGNGSTDAGAERLDAMRRRILKDDRKAGIGQDSKAYRHLKA